MPLELSFHEYGNGPPLIILHGLFGSAQNWRAIAERLADRWRIFACDLRNHGASPWRPTMSFVEMADDLEALIAAKGLAPAIILGHSVGGKVAMLTALRHAELVDSLVVVDIAPVAYEEPFAEWVAAMRAIDLEHATRKADVDEALASVVINPATRMFLLQNLEERDAGGFAWRLNLAAIAENMDALLGFPDVSALTYEGRALFVSGAGSDYIGKVHHGAVWDVFPQAEFAVIDGAGHYPHAEQPAAFLARLELFLESNYA